MTVILVTGASGSIGRATVVRLARGGHQVYAAARRQEPLDALARQNPGIRALPLDVTDAGSIAAAAGRINADTAGRGPDVIINAAGIAVLGPAEAIPAEQVRHQFEVNLVGPLAVAGTFLPAMRSRGSGRIVNVSSILGRFALPGTGVYSASKFALEALSDAMRAELAPFGVSVVLVEPGVTDTAPVLRRRDPGRRLSGRIRRVPGHGAGRRRPPGPADAPGGLARRRRLRHRGGRHGPASPRPVPARYPEPVQHRPAHHAARAARGPDQDQDHQRPERGHAPNLSRLGPCHG
jgi:NAD(P)-dependent dehydrogenase (short-subunit alcohol dehydrogenase family)